MGLPPDRENRTRRETNVFLAGVFVFFAASELARWYSTQVARSGLPAWVCTDWLIDYSGGFVRRGLAGEVIRRLSGFVPPRELIGVLILGIFGGVVAAFVWLVVRSRDRLHPVLSAGVLFLPSLLPFYLYGNGTFGRKETLGLLVLARHLRLLEGCRDGAADAYARKLWPVSLVALPALVLIHEASAFLFLPVHVFISEAMGRLDPSVDLPRRLRRLALVYLPTLLALLAIVLFGRPTVAAVAAMCRHWQAGGALPAGAGGADEALPAAFRGLAWSFTEAVRFTTATSAAAVAEWLAVLALFALATAWVGVMVTDAMARGRLAGIFELRAFGRMPGRRVLAKYFVVPLAFSAPLYLVGCDLGRWLSATCTGYILVTLSPEITDAEIRGTAGAGGIQAVDPGIAAPASSRAYYLCLPVFLAILFFVRLPPTNVRKWGMFASPGQSWMEPPARAGKRPRAAGDQDAPPPGFDPDAKTR